MDLYTFLNTVVLNLCAYPFFYLHIGIVVVVVVVCHLGGQVMFRIAVEF